MEHILKGNRTCRDCFKTGYGPVARCRRGLHDGEDFPALEEGDLLINMYFVNALHTFQPIKNFKNWDPENYPVCLSCESDISDRLRASQ
jgi:hypothetical protein